jgi:hypothetical protein
MDNKNKAEFSLAKTIQRLAELGLDEREISFSLGLTSMKFKRLKENKEIEKALNKGLENSARVVEHALYRRAVGFEYEEVVNSTTDSPLTASTPKIRNEDRNDKEKAKDRTKSNPKTKSGFKSTVKTVIPDVTACIFWLKNRLPDKWSDYKKESNGKLSIQDLVEAYEEEDEENISDQER